MKDSIKEKIANLLKEQRFAVIATQSKNEPYTNLVTFLVKEELKKIYFPTLKKTKKYENLSSNSRISMLIDNRGNKPKDIEKAMVVTAVGNSRETKDTNIADDFLDKHPYLKDFIDSPDCAMIELNVEKYIVVEKFEKVTVFSF